MRLCGEYGRDDVDSICKEVEGKTEEEVRFPFSHTPCYLRPSLVGESVCQGVLGAKGGAD